MTTPYAMLPERVMPGVKMDRFLMKRLAVWHQHADVGRKRLMNIKWKSNKRTKLTVSNERNNLTLSHSSSESCNTSSFACFAQSGSSLAMCDTKVSTDWMLNQYLL